MIILRIFLYLTCIISIGWSILVFGGPPIIKRLVIGYSNGVLVPSGVTVSPGLDLRISRLEFYLKNQIAGYNVEGFSRAIEIEWSLFGKQKAFLKIDLGPSVVKDRATATRVNIYTPSFQNIDWQNIALALDVEDLAVQEFLKMQSLTIDGIVNSENTTLSDVNIEANEVSAIHENSTYLASFIKGDLNEINLNTNLTKQIFSSTFAVEDITISEPNLTVPDASIEVFVTENARNFKVDLNNLELVEFGGFVDGLKVDGRFDQGDVLQDLDVNAVNIIPFKGSPKFLEILAKIRKVDDQQYQTNIDGSMEEFELSGSDGYIGLLPSSNFAIDLDLDRAVSKMAAISKVKFNTLSAAQIIANVDMELSSKILPNLGCKIKECELSDFNLSYKINFDDEWVRGISNCSKSRCSIPKMDHLIRTSNTVNIFTILNKANILTPVSSLYLYGAISSGQKINDGHELIFQF